MSDSALVLVEPGTAPGVWHLLLNRRPVNAFSTLLYEACLAAFDRLEAESDLRCLVIGSTVDGAFCAGADTKELGTLTADPGDESAWSRREALTMQFLRRVEEFPVPTIAAVDGYAVGMGFVIASLCDMRIASDRAWFSIPELAVRRAGGARHAMRVLPQGTVRWLYFTRGRLDAVRAYQLGLVESLVDGGAARAEADARAGEIAEVSAAVLREAKAALRLMEELPTWSGVQVERLHSRRMSESDRAEVRP